MILGAATHFSQGWATSGMERAAAIGATRIRDSISWSTIETAPGLYDFSDPRVAYVHQAIKQGLDVTLLFSSTNPLYDGGTTPHTGKAIDAYANFIAAAVAHFKGVSAIEIGNEFNGNNFVSGTVKTASYSLRDEHYMDILSKVAKTVSASAPDVKILGGAVHSLPIGYLNELFDKGALDLVDGITLHPYTSAPEQLGDQLDLLNAAMGDDRKPIYVTEFGQGFANLADAPAYLLKMTAVMAASNVASADWYALQEQKWFPNMELVNKAGVPTPAGKSFSFIQEHLLEHGVPTKISLDSATYGYLFGDNILVIWGEEQTIKVTAPTKFYTATGQLIENFDGKIHFDEPIIAVSETPIVAGKTLFSTGTGIVADSFHDFDMSNAKGSDAGFEGPWSYFQLSGTGVLVPLYTMAGGTRADEPWTPYIGTESLRPLRLDSNSVNPVDFGNGASPAAKYSIVERFTAQKSEKISISGHWDVSDKSADGVDLTILHNGKKIYSTIIYNQKNGNVLDLTLDDLSVATGDTIDFVLGTNKTSAGGDVTERRITIKSEGTIVDLPRTVGVTIAGTAGNDVVNALQSVAGGLVATAGSDTLFGYAGNDKLDGGGGGDTMYGGSGNDTYTVDDRLDGAIETKANGADEGGADQVNASVDFTLGRFVENLTLTGTGTIDGTGNEIANKIVGNASANILTGGAGDDALYGNAGADLLRGDAGNDKLFGGDGSDTLEGGVGKDYLDGGTGADTSRGGAGADTYIVDHLADVVDEVAGQSADDGSVDSVTSSVDFTLGRFVENLSLTGAAIKGTGNEIDNKIVGNTLGNTLIGNDGDDGLHGDDGNDTLNGGNGDDTLNGGTGTDILDGGAGKDALDGGTGADIMRGGAGADKYTVDHVGDVVDEAYGQAADDDSVDLVTSSVDYALGAFVENLTLAGKAVVGTGNELANKIVGTAAANILDGGAGADTLIAGDGNDTLIGGAGKDTLTGGAGADRFVFSWADLDAADKIMDFSTVQRDKVVFNGAEFGLSVGSGATAGNSLASDYFQIGTVATSGHAQFLFDSKTKVLSYDADGHAGDAIAIATLSGAATLSNADFFII